MIESFRREYNEIRPHSSLGQLTLLEFKRKLSQAAPEPELLPAGPSGDCPVVKTTESYISNRTPERPFPKVTNGPKKAGRSPSPSGARSSRSNCGTSIKPGKPDQNAFVERFNRTYREEVLDAHLFGSIAQVRDLTESWIPQYNEERPGLLDVDLGDQFSRQSPVIEVRFWFGDATLPRRWVGSLRTPEHRCQSRRITARSSLEDT
jgi:Integrase core domain